MEVFQAEEKHIPEIVVLHELITDQIIFSHYSMGL
jgi:hypothetical protein